MVELTSALRSKADDALINCIEGIESTDLLAATWLRVVVTIVNPADTADSDGNEDGSETPASYTDRRAYRHALIERRRAQLRGVLDEVKARLHAESLTVNGGLVSRSIVVEGRASGVLSVLDDANIARITLDQEVVLRDGESAPSVDD